jgi:hypothetical protein
MLSTPSDLFWERRGKTPWVQINEAKLLITSTAGDKSGGILRNVGY